MSIAAAEAVRVCRGRVVGTLPAQIDCVTDSRRLRAGQTYLALRGENYDGHDFVEAAFAAGAAAAIIEESATVTPANALLVADTRAAYQALAAAARTNFCGAVVAITGSAGKTTTKEFLAQILQRLTGGPVLATVGNENNEIGVAKLLLQLENQTAAVVEMGARHHGDIAPLVVMARPQVAVLTNIGDAHLEIFGSRERLAQTKWQIFDTGAIAVLNLNDTESRARSHTISPPPWFTGLLSDRTLTNRPAAYGGIVLVERDQLTFDKAGSAPQTIAVEITVAGSHNLRNVAAACGAALALGFSLERVAASLNDLRLPSGRYEKRTTAAGAVVVHDAYNASPSGTLATLHAFSQEVATRRIVVFGSMAELGLEAVKEHERVANAIAELGPDIVFVGGAFAADLERALNVAGFSSDRIVRFVDNAAVTSYLQPYLRAGDVVLVKGSRMYKLEEIVEGLTQPAVPK